MKKTLMTMQLNGSSVELKGCNESMFEVVAKQRGGSFGIIYTFDRRQMLQALNKFHSESDKVRAKAGALCSA